VTFSFSEHLSALSLSESTASSQLLWFVSRQQLVTVRFHTTRS